jgi:hypothetical protein
VDHYIEVLIAFVKVITYSNVGLIALSKKADERLGLVIVIGGCPLNARRSVDEGDAMPPPSAKYISTTKSVADLEGLPIGIDLSLPASVELLGPVWPAVLESPDLLNAPNSDGHCVQDRAPRERCASLTSPVC